MAAPPTERPHRFSQRGRQLTEKGFQVALGVLFIAAFYVLSSYFVASEYQSCVCSAVKPPSEACPKAEALSGWFFAGQTITTTGYGAGGVQFDNPCVKLLACWAMPIGSFLWGIAIGVLVVILTKTDD